MEYKLSRYGAVTLDGVAIVDEEPITPHVTIIVPGAFSCRTQKLGNLFFITSFTKANDKEHYLTLFKYHGGCKPRCVPISSLPSFDEYSELDILKSLFSLLLNFDNGKLSNRDRNTLLAAVRYNLPNVVKGVVTFNDVEYDYFLLANQLTVFIKGTNQVVTRVEYQMLSRPVIKGIFK